ncbi:YihY/virulence factor BrkB family protein [Nannocystis sp.]|uniref:YihY/virulence factor BrkB family protein n=1 Tax=Nannocystis sp. TaxID=1962667 RepID=UPI002420ED94|nr:YihY/virulence factor BrkB family protein [Nannocystis sp.]MBK7826720.1 YihY/virulence factor BrkB family protein [Nannocystis sp.]MBK9754340.1 YihY/virulence factor BrkB family protein [Nannocystis sp.]
MTDSANPAPTPAPIPETILATSATPASSATSLQSPAPVRAVHGWRRLPMNTMRLLRFTLRVLSHLSKNHALLLAGGIAYNVMLSIVPLLTVLLVVLTRLLDRQQLLDIISTELALLIPSQAQSITDQVGALIDNADIIGGVGILVLLFFSSWAFKILEGALAIVFARTKARRVRGVWMSLLIPYIWILVLGVGLFVLTVVVGFVEAVSETDLHLFGRIVSLGAMPALMLKLTGFLTLVVLFTSIYHVLPISEVSFKRALAGGLAAAILWDILRRFLMVYFAKISLVNTVYGSLATVIIVLLTLEFAALIILFGAQVISEIQHSEEAGLPWYEGVPVEEVVGVRQG